ncbi:MAG: hypothetical protein ACXABY_16700 [Candidatus Thorarchaeota archaeon]|jgi:hypothetical protein
MGIPNSSLAEYSGLAGNTGSKTAFTYLELGTDDTAFAAAQTALQAAITDSGLARAAATVSQETTTQTDDTLQLTKQWTASGSKTVKEAGVFNNSSGGTMGARTVLGTARALTSGDTYTYTYQIIFAGA